MTNTHNKNTTFRDDVPQNAVIFDHQGFSDRLLGNQELMKKIINNFISSTTIQINELNDAINEKDSSKICAIAHKLKGSTSTVGCMQLSEIASSAEVLARHSDICGLVALFPTLQESCSVSIKKIKEKFKI